MGPCYVHYTCLRHRCGGHPCRLWTPAPQPQHHRARVVWPHCLATGTGADLGAGWAVRDSSPEMCNWDHEIQPGCSAELQRPDPLAGPAVIWGMLPGSLPLPWHLLHLNAVFSAFAGRQGRESPSTRWLVGNSEAHPLGALLARIYLCQQPPAASSHLTCSNHRK